MVNEIKLHEASYIEGRKNYEIIKATYRHSHEESAWKALIMKLVARAKKKARTDFAISRAKGFAAAAIADLKASQNGL